MNGLLLLLAVALSSGRSICSKKIVFDTNNKRTFFLSQAVLFLAAGCTVAMCNPKGIINVSAATLLLSVIYGILLIISQWCYTISLQRGPTAICTMLYSFGFIFPTLSGALFWNESFTVFSGIGLTLTIVAIIVSAFSKEAKKHDNSKKYLLPILLAMVASGGLGVMQKIQQNSNVADQRDGFLFFAFAIAMIFSFGTSALKSNQTAKNSVGIFPVLAGICFGAANLLNTLLAGRIDSAILFPIQNIGVMIICAIFGIVVFRERITKSQYLALGLGVVAILVLGIF